MIVVIAMIVATGAALMRMILMLAVVVIVVVEVLAVVAVVGFLPAQALTVLHLSSTLSPPLTLQGTGTGTLRGLRGTETLTPRTVVLARSTSWKRA